MEEILAGRSMCVSSVEHKFHSSAIVGGCLSMAVGVAAAIKRDNKKGMVHCFLGDMAATTGAFHEAKQYAFGHWLPIRFIVEDNGLSCDTPTKECWGDDTHHPKVIDGYRYTRKHAHAGTGKDLF